MGAILPIIMTFLPIIGTVETPDKTPDPQEALPRRPSLSGLKSGWYLLMAGNESPRTVAFEKDLTKLHDLHAKNLLPTQVYESRTQMLTDAYLARDAAVPVVNAVAPAAGAFGPSHPWLSFTSLSHNVTNTSMYASPQPQCRHRSLLWSREVDPATTETRRHFRYVICERLVNTCSPQFDACGRDQLL